MDLIKLIIIDGILYTPASALSEGYLMDNARNPDLWKIKDKMLGYRNEHGEALLCRYSLELKGYGEFMKDLRAQGLPCGEDDWRIERFEATAEKIEVFDKQRLSNALFDAREMGNIPANVQEVLTPEGEVFVIDYDYETIEDERDPTGQDEGIGELDEPDTLANMQ